MTRSRRMPLILEPRRMESRFADAYRALRVTVCSSNGERAPVSVLVASAGADEGRSTTVANLGIIAGQAGSRVILVDADLRDPCLHLLLKAPDGAGSAATGPPPGLAEVVRDGAAPEELIQQTCHPGVWLLAAGVDRSRPSGLITSPRTAELLRDLREQADLVLVDSPPCLEYADAVELAAAVDALLYVVRSGDQDQAGQRQVQSQLLHTSARKLGVVFNRG